MYKIKEFIGKIPLPILGLVTIIGTPILATFAPLSVTFGFLGISALILLLGLIWK